MRVTRRPSQVGQDKQAAAADPRGASFGTTLTREQLEALSDDPEVLRQQLQDMAGPGAVIKVDSFEGGALPSKSQIRSIRISRDQFAAEHHAAGGVNIEIITQPGLGPLRMNFGYRQLGDGLSGRSPFTPVRGPEQNRDLFVGTAERWSRTRRRSTCFSTTSAARRRRTSTSRSATARRAPKRSACGRRPTASVSTSISTTRRRSIRRLRFAAGYNGNDASNLGIGQWDEETRAYARDSGNGFVRLQQIGPLGRRAFLRTRLQYRVDRYRRNLSAVEAPTIRVNDAFTSGGAQMAGGQHAKTGVFAIGSRLRARQPHLPRPVCKLDASRWRSDDQSNYLGTYTFESLAAFEAGTPRSYTRRIGNPDLRYNYLQGALYAQDDIRVRRNLTLSGGVRYEAQSHVSDFNNVMPRFGVTWAPGAAGTTTLRGSWGIFHDWLPTNTYEQTLRVDGFRQQEIDIVNPPYPTFSDLTLQRGAGQPVCARRRCGDAADRPASASASIGVTRWSRQARRMRTRAAAPSRAARTSTRRLNGVRPDPRFGNIIEVMSDASSRQHQLQTNLTVNQGALFPLPKSAPRFGMKRVTLFLNYTLARAPQQHRRRVQRRAARRSRPRVGRGQQRRAAPHEHQSQQPDHEEPRRWESTSTGSAARPTRFAPAWMTTAI